MLAKSKSLATAVMNSWEGVRVFKAVNARSCFPSAARYLAWKNRRVSDPVSKPTPFSMSFTADENFPKAYSAAAAWR